MHSYEYIYFLDKTISTPLVYNTGIVYNIGALETTSKNNKTP